MATERQRRSARAALARVPRWVLALFALGVVVRLGLMVLYTPAALQNPDTIAYVTLRPFHDAREPSGLNLFAVPFRWVGSFTLLVLAQHALGVLTAALLATGARRLGCGWITTGIVAAVALFASDVLYLEHAVLTEPLFTALAAGALVATVPGPRGAAFPSAPIAGAAAGAAVCTRTLGFAVVAAVAVGLLLASGSPLRGRLLRSAAATATAAAVVGLYLLGAGLTTNGKSGIGDWSGWYAYARAASFADCTRFTPPPGTHMLCETTPTDQRGGPSSYLFDPASPARRAFGGPPVGGAAVGRFGRAAILAEPAAYAHVVLRGLLRYVDDSFGRDRPGFGGGYDTIALDRRDPVAEATVAAQASRSPFGAIHPPVVHAWNLIRLYAAVLAIDGRVLLVLLLLAAAAAALARGDARRGVALYGGLGLALLVLPVMTLSYEARYALPPALLLTVPAAVGADALARQMLARSTIR